MTTAKYSPEEPIAAVATALAPGALGIVRASGKGTIQLVSKIFSRPKALLEAYGNTIVYGWILESEKSSAAPVDEVLVSVFKAPKSFTGEDMCEISCHGGVAVVKSVYEVLLKNGFRPAERGEFTFRSYINGKSDLTKAEAVREIIDSKTDKSRMHAASRLSGNLFKEIEGIKTLVTDTVAAIEVDIEYPEDEETIADSFDPKNLELARQRLFELASSWKSEKLYQDGAKIVLAGKTNAGKSSLFNSLLKEDRSIVSDREGTTRDWIESWVSFDGIPARLYDTAGLRETGDVIEAKGIELTKDLALKSDLILYLIDATAGIDADDEKFIRGTENSPVIIVFNKCDVQKPARNFDFTELNPLVKGSVLISAKKGTGIGCLTELVKKTILKDEKTSSESVALGSQRQKEAVEEALERVSHALEIAGDGSFGLDAVVQDLEDCLDSLGEITGEVTPDDILGSIFSHFCVGK